MTQDKRVDASDPASNAFARIFDLTIRLATSRVGQITAYFAAVTAAVVAFQKVAEPLKDTPPWMRAALIFSLPLLVLIFQIIPALFEQRRKKRLTEITGNLHSGYFSLRPREDAASFKRADGEHQEILQWIEKHRGLLYLTGLSGTGKSSLLNAWVLPHLKEQGAQVIRLRGYQDPLAALQHELLHSGVIWQKPPSEAMEMRALLERACRYIRPRRLLVVFDQFEEFVILQNLENQQWFSRSQFLSSMRHNPIEELTLLLVFRSDYIGLVEKLQLPPLVQDTNWKEVSPFTQRAAQEFLQGSGLEIDEELLQDVLREAAEIERTKGLTRPITINLCGLVLSRFATGLPRGFRPGGLIPGFIRESVLLPEIRDVAPRVIPHLIKSNVTKQPRTVAELSQSTALESQAVLGCLRRLGQSDRGIVRPVDSDQELWEISHDFLVPLLDSLVARWRTAFWKRILPWAPWMAAASMILAVMFIPSWQKDPIVRLTQLGWIAAQNAEGVGLAVNGLPPKGSLQELKRIPRPIAVKLDTIDATISEWRVLNHLKELYLSNSNVRNVQALTDLKSLTTLDISSTEVSDVAPLRELKNMTQLELASTKVSDVRPLSELKSLTSLGLSNTRVRDLAPLRNLTNLSELDLHFTKVNDLGPLRDLKNLTTLDIGNIEASDVGPLRKLKKLTYLNLGYTHASDLEPLKDLTNLTTLYIHGTKINSVGPLTELRNLTKLDLSNVPVSDIEPLRRLRNLIEVDLSGTRVSNVGPLNELKTLTKLNLGSTRVSDLGPLTELKGLIELDLHDTGVSDLTPLKGLKNLTKLSLDNTRVSDLGPLTELKGLIELGLDRTAVTDVGPLKELKNLTSLSLSYSSVSDVRPLEGLKSLTKLDLRGTKVSDVRPLKELTNLTELDLSGTRVSDVGPLKEMKNLLTLYLSGVNVSMASVNELQNALPELNISR